MTPRGFRGLSEDDAPELYWPITTYAGSRAGENGRDYFTTYNWGWMEMMVRRKAGVSREVANADLSAAYVRSWQASREQSPEMAPVDVAQPRAIAGALKGAAGPDPGLEARTLLWTSGVALIVLLIAAANVTNLFLARVLRRRREVALRLALGVRRWRLALQSVVESVTLALLGAVAGLAVAQWGGLALRRAFVGESATFDLWRDGRTMAVAFTLAVTCGVVTGLIAALLGEREDLAGALKAGAREGTHQRSRLRSALLVLQSALSVVLLVGAALFVRSLHRVSTLRLGYDVEPVLMVVRNLRGTTLSDSAELRLGNELIAAARALPDVEAASYVSSIPFYSTNSTRLFVTGIDSVARRGRFTYQVATPDYFRVMGTRILRGRPFEASDRLDAPLVAVVSERMADRLWPGQEAIGQCLRVGGGHDAMYFDHRHRRERRAAEPRGRRGTVLHADGPAAEWWRLRGAAEDASRSRGRRRADPACAAEGHAGGVVRHRAPAGDDHRPPAAIVALRGNPVRRVRRLGAGGGGGGAVRGDLLWRHAAYARAGGARRTRRPQRGRDAPGARAGDAADCGRGGDRAGTGAGWRGRSCNRCSSSSRRATRASWPQWPSRCLGWRCWRAECRRDGRRGRTPTMHCGLIDGDGAGGEDTRSA